MSYCSSLLHTHLLRWRPFLVALIVVTLVAGQAPAAFSAESSQHSNLESEEQVDLYQVGASALDVALLRPLGILSVIGGFAFFAVSLPFVAPTEHIETAWDIFVYGPYDYTVERPLGELI